MDASEGSGQENQENQESQGVQEGQEGQESQGGQGSSAARSSAGGSSAGGGKSSSKGGSRSKGGSSSKGVSTSGGGGGGSGGSGSGSSGGASELAELGKSGPQPALSKPDAAGLSAGRKSVDVGPGDPQAAPSGALELVDIPRPPTQSELVVKSTPSDKSGGLSAKLGTMSGKSVPRFETIRSVPKSGSATKQAAEVAVKSVPKAEALLKSSAGSGSASGKSTTPSITMAPLKTGSSAPHKSGSSVAKSTDGSSAAKSGSGAKKSGPRSSESVAKKSTLAASGPKSSGPKSSGSSAAAASAASGSKSPGSSAGSAKSAQSPDSGSQASSVKSESPGVVRSVSKSKSKSPHHDHERDHERDHAAAADGLSDLAGPAGATRKHGNKVTKFRYHKRITVRTHGRTSPSAIMEKVRKKDTITPSTIEDMDPQELIQKAGIKGGKNTHWRIRLRQTKRLTKGGKTVTQTKVAYRDSKGHKHVKTSTDPDCKKCGKKLEDCRCNEGEE